MEQYLISPASIFSEMNIPAEKANYLSNGMSSESSFNSENCTGEIEHFKYLINDRVSYLDSMKTIGKCIETLR